MPVRSLPRPPALSFACVDPPTYPLLTNPPQLFYVGMRMGFLMRQQAVAAVHGKVLRLNSAAIAHVSSGHVVNLVSNDVRRFDDAMPFWVFLWAGMCVCVGGGGRYMCGCAGPGG